MEAKDRATTEQIEYWNGEAGAMWAKRQDRMDALLAPITEATLGACSVNAGDKVLDVGCGCGDTTLRFAALGATATGVDVSKPMLARARERAAANSLTTTFLLGDAAETRFDAEYDLLFSRFGVMFFDNPTAAFANLHSALRPSAKLCFVCWQAPNFNPWISVPFSVALPMLPPQPTLEPRAPGPFAFAERRSTPSTRARSGRCPRRRCPRRCIGRPTTRRPAAPPVRSRRRLPGSARSVRRGRAPKASWRPISPP